MTACPHCGQKMPRNAERNQAIIAARASGEILESIAARYGITHERVRQITAKAVREQDARSARRGWRIEDWKPDHVLAGVLQHGSLVAFCKTVAGLVPKAAYAILSADPEIDARYRAFAKTRKGAPRRPESVALARPAYEARAEGLTWAQVGQRIGKFPTDARRLALRIGPDPLGEEGSRRGRRPTIAHEARP